MTEGRIYLSELEVDALTELVNICVSRAAASLRQMVGRQVFLSVPSVEVVGRADAVNLMAERETGGLVAVRQDFDGAFAGRALLIFPEANSMALVQAVTGGELSDADMREFEDEALAETGNVVLNNCLATMANMLQRPLEMSLPGVMRGEGARLFQLDEAATADGVVLFLYINFAISERDIRGYIAVLMDLSSLDSLKTLIAEFIARVVGPSAAAEV
ncbi:chemotaxis protein CheX [Phenylobacterium sp. J367]|uniref:chemotaxis protein CheX n=1 Tax=Phenylobacterium sp. J367 TaxID=2898435 RepID=UPI0021514CA9|nr:chemotaxis protein CheX [Phenylobacterium sp. J367]MCR5881118.1 chemotaxis protein CheX [Phenylobacterium sp. J367]